MFSNEIINSLLKALEKLEISFLFDKIQLEHPADFSHGDYSTNIALIAAKEIGKPPKETAKEIIESWKETGLPDFIEKVEVAGPGFINIWFKINALGKEIERALREGIKPLTFIENKTVIIDYSAPNIAKPFGIGHLRSTNIGQALYNIYKFLGWKTIGDSHIGDWGTQFGKLIYMIKMTERKGREIEDLTIADLEKLYVKFHEEAEKNPKIEDEARGWFKKLEDGDAEARKIWQACVDISMKEYDRIYKLLGIKIDYTYGESFYQDKMAEALNDCRRKGILKESEGALVVEIPGMETPAMLVKSDGATTYLLRDLATIKFRIKTWRPDLIIYEVGADQSFHFRQLFSLAQMLGYGDIKQFVHVPHGLIRWSTGKFSTRRGITIHLEEILLEAIARARKLMEGAGVAYDLNEDEKKKIAVAVGVGGIKYNDLKQNPRTDIIFDWDQILTLSGNSGPYLQYTYARIQSLLRKGKRSNLSDLKLSDEEVILLRTVYRFPEVVEEAACTYSPNLICNFLFDLAQKFNLFYDRQKIIGSEMESFRLLLSAAVGQVLKEGLNLLGIEALGKM